MKKDSISTYLVISIFCFLLLAMVQFILVRNTYELTRDRFYFAERTAMKESYSRSIKNDKIFPGASEIIDTYFNRHLDSLKQLYLTDRPAFESYKQVIADSIFRELREKQSIPRFIDKFRMEKNIHDSMEYGLIVESLSIAFKNDTFVPLYDKKEYAQFIEAVLQEKAGVRIGGDLKNINVQNKVNGFSIKGGDKYVYRINFSLHVQPHNMGTAILREMILTFALSLFSILTVVILFFVTFSNWVKQKKLSEMKSDFINNITHELHTPLAAIIVANKNLQNERIVEKKENIFPLTQVIQRQSERLKKLIGEVLDIVSGDKISVDAKKHPVNDLLDEILLDYHLKLIGTRVNLEFNKETNDDVVPLDKFHFTTMLLNLFDNAVKYNPKEEKELKVTTRRDKYHNLQILIQDNGTGIRRERLKLIFDKFYRSNDQLKSQPKGLGLGLYYVKQIADAHHWTITVDSAPGVGSLFTITIPHKNGHQ